MLGIKIRMPLAPEWIVIFVFFFLNFIKTGTSADVLFVGGLFTQFSLDSAGNFVVDQGGVRSVPAVQMAIDRVNNKSDGVYDGLLPNTQLELLVRDTKIQTEYALEETYDLAKRNCVGFIGAWDSGTTVEVSKLLSIASIDRAIIAYSATSSQLSDPEFSNVLRTKESDQVPAKVIAELMTGQFDWRCANILVGVSDPYSFAAAKAFESAAKDNNIDVCTKANYEPGSDMQMPIKQIMDNKCCLATVVFGQTANVASLLLEAHRQNYAGEWIMGDDVMGSLDTIVNDLNNHLDEDSTHELLRGIFTLSAKQVKSKEFLEFEKAWYSQPSTAKMSENGTRSDCSDAVDATGRYIWREDGKKEGRCCGIDFEQVGQKWRLNNCSSGDPVCASAAISTYVPFAYDAGIALAHGLHELVHRRGLLPDKITADLLSQAIKNSTFEGVSGPVSFLSNGDRRADHFEYAVYNYHETTRGFELVGQIVNGAFNATSGGSEYASIVFSDGSSHVPVVRVLLVGGFFSQFRADNKGEYGIDQLGLSVLPAAQMAINRVNDKSDGIFDELMPRIKLELLVRDTKSEPKHAVDEASELIQFGSAGYMGAFGSAQSIEVAKLLSLHSINRAMVGYAAGSPQLGTDRFSNYVRTNPSVQTKAELVVKLMKDHFNWSCVNILSGLGDVYSVELASAFEVAAKNQQIDVFTKATYKSGSLDMRAPIKKIVDSRFCQVTVLYGQLGDVAALLLEADRQNYAGEWVMPDAANAHVGPVVQYMKKHLDEASIHRLMRGIFSLQPKKLASTAFREFEKAWYSQPSTAKMSENGIRSDCSDAVDATGRYIWREDGKKEGRCCGIDFEKAGQKWRLNNCSSGDPVCASAATSTYVSFAYDAGIALAHGLHELVHRRGLSSEGITADLLSQAIKSSTFEGVTGPVSFLSNGDRRSDHFEYLVYNYHETSRRFETVGQMVNGSFTANCDPDPCASFVFSDGTSRVPVSRSLLVGGLFPQFSSKRDNMGDTIIDEAGIRRMTAVVMAIDSINKDRNVLPQTKLELVIGDSKRQERNAMAEAYRLHTGGSVALIGPASSGPTQAVSRWLSLPAVEPHRLLMGYSATSVELRKREFSNFLRTPPGDDIQVVSMTKLMKDYFKWNCANIFKVKGDDYSLNGATAFEKEASGIACRESFTPDKTDMDEFIKRVKDKCSCRANVVFGKFQDLVPLLVAAHKKQYGREWVVGYSLLGSLDDAVKKMTRQMKDTHGFSKPRVHEVLRGVFTLVSKQVKNKEFRQFEKAWYSQPSTAKMSENGTRSDCSDAVDASGRYIWREDGKKEGRCCGIDFEQAGKKWSLNKCSNDDLVCTSAAITTYVPFAYDAGVALAHGLHELVHRRGLRPDEITADLLLKAIRNSTFEGVTGPVSFESDNGDRRSTQFEWMVYNYHDKTGRFEAVGQVVNGNFTKQCEDGNCLPMVFRDGTGNIPKVDDPAEDPAKEGNDNVVLFFIVVLLVLVFGFVVAGFIYRWFERSHRKLAKEREKQHLLTRLEKNWSELLDSDWVDGLSEMPKEWKSGIVPVRSETGAALHKRLHSVGKQIIKKKTRQSRLLVLKKKLKELIEKEVAPFFASRNDMYRRYLVNDPRSTHVTESVHSPGTTQARQSEKHSNLRKQRMSEGELPWLDSSNALFKQIMLLLRDLDNMFKASYNQRYDLRILHEEKEAYAEWMKQQLPQLMPKQVTLAQNTPHLFELYRQAAQVHSYYNKVCARIAKQTRALWYPAPLKKIFRILEKAEHVQHENSVFFDCTRIFDIVRGTLIYRKLGDEPGGVLRGIRALFDCPQLQIIRVKDRFNNPTSACWRDALFNARMVSSQGTIEAHIVEIQLHQWDLREERMNVGGHFIYERHRALFEACETVFGSGAIAKLEDLHNHCELAQDPV